MATETGTINVPICASCNKIIQPKTKTVKLTCPNCGEIRIWRCQRCRKFARLYRCPKCGFIGP